MQKKSIPERYAQECLSVLDKLSSWVIPFSVWDDCRWNNL